MVDARIICLIDVVAGGAIQILQKEDIHHTVLAVTAGFFLGIVRGHSKVQCSQAVIGHIQ